MKLEIKKLPDSEVEISGEIPAERNFVKDRDSRISQRHDA